MKCLFHASWVILSGVLLGALLPSSPAAESLTFLHARGQDIVNEHGQKILLRGVGLGNWLLPEGYMWKFGKDGDRPRRIEKLVSDLIGPDKAGQFWTAYRKNYIDEADIQQIAELGYNSVRPALNARLFLTEAHPAAPVQEGYDLLDALVQRCKRQGIYVIIDMHAAPGGQTGQNIDDSAKDQPELFIKAENQDRLVQLWRTLAKRYKEEPTVAGYDLLNEPLPERTGAAAKFKHQLEPLYQRITKAIREVDAKHMIFLEGVDWANDWSVFSAPFDNNLVYQFHYYCWDNPVRLKPIDSYVKLGRQFNAPIWVGETGESREAIYWATTEYFEASNIGWSFWPWKKLDAVNAPYSIKVPAQWDNIVAYSQGGAKPSREVAQRAFDELLANIQLKNCLRFPGVINAMLRRLPCRIEAENYAHEGLNRSFGVKNATNYSKFYRLEEPVRVEFNNAGRRRGDQFITLKATEWTSYTFDNDAAAKSFALTLKVRAGAAPAQAQVEVGGRVLKVDVRRNDWSEIKLGAVTLIEGTHRLKWLIQQGSVDLDWIELSEQGQPSIQLGQNPKPNGG